MTAVGWDTDCSTDVSDSRRWKGRRVMESNPDVPQRS